MKGKKIGVLAITLIISASTMFPSNADMANVRRISGSNRIQTSYKIAKENPSKKVYLVNSKSFADALSVGPLATLERSNIILHTNINDTVEFLKSKNIREVIIVGGESSIGKDIYNHLAKKYTISRISGKNRYETSIMIAKKFSSKNVGITSGSSFTDALSSGAFLSKMKMPLILVDPNNPVVPKEFIPKYTFGGTSTLNKTFGKRISGKDRYETAEKIANEYGKFENVIIASGVNLADALSSTPLAFNLNAPILLTDGNSLTEGNRNILKKVKSSIIVGGNESVSDSLFKSISSGFEKDNKENNKPENGNDGKEKKPENPNNGKEKKPGNPNDGKEKKPGNPNDGKEKKPGNPKDDKEKKPGNPNDGKEKKPENPKDGKENKPENKKDAERFEITMPVYSQRVGLLDLSKPSEEEIQEVKGAIVSLNPNKNIKSVEVNSTENKIKVIFNDDSFKELEFSDFILRKLKIDKPDVLIGVYNPFYLTKSERETIEDEIKSKNASKEIDWEKYNFVVNNDGTIESNALIVDDINKKQDKKLTEGTAEMVTFIAPIEVKPLKVKDEDKIQIPIKVSSDNELSDNEFTEKIASGDFRLTQEQIKKVIDLIIKNYGSNQNPGQNNRYPLVSKGIEANKDNDLARLKVEILTEEGKPHSFCVFKYMKEDGSEVENIYNTKLPLVNFVDFVKEN